MSFPNRPWRISDVGLRGPRDARSTFVALAACAALMAVAPCAAAQQALPPPPAAAPLRLRDRLEIAGGVVFGVGFLPAAVAGAVMPLAIEPGSALIQWYPIEAIPIPVVGPGLYGASLLTSSSCDAGCHALAAVFLTDAVVQLAGAILMLAGPLVDRDATAPVSSTADRRTHWTLGLGPATAPLGLSLRVAHF